MHDRSRISSDRAWRAGGYAGCVFCVLVLLWPGAHRLWSQQGGEDLPGDAARVAYELGFAYLLANEPQRARSYLEEAAATGGPFADLARLELVRLIALDVAISGAATEAGAGTADQTNAAVPDADVIAEIRGVLLAFEDRTRVDEAWYAGVQSLETAGRYAAAIELALELPLRYPNGPRADDALFVAARLRKAEGQKLAALDPLYRIVESYATGDLRESAYLLIAHIYSEPGPLFSPARACAALRAVRFPLSVERKQSNQTMPSGRGGWADVAAESALAFQRDFCEF